MSDRDLEKALASDDVEAALKQAVQDCRCDDLRDELIYAEGQVMNLKEDQAYLIKQATPETQEFIDYILNIPNVTELREFMDKAGIA